MKSIVTIFCCALFLVSCGGKKGGLNKDTKADYQFDDKTLKEMGQKDAEALKSYEGKVVESKGIIKSFKPSKSSASPNKYSFYLCTDANQEDYTCTICYTDTDQTSMVGKQVTVKGKFDYAGVITLDDCVVY